MTNKQRAKIYRQAAEKVFDGKHKGGGSAINNSIPKNIECNENFFPEYFLFKPRIKKILWWDAKEPRILALLLSEQMALNP